MGMTFCTLHLYAVERDTLVKKLAPGDLLREQNAPWLSLVPVYDPEHVETQRLEKLAKALTKGAPQAAALLFSYFDDERFLCSFFRDGRKQAGCLSQESWAKLGKKLDELFGDTSATKAFRYAARCFDLEEQVRLLEDSVGAALYDFPEEAQPRRVPRSDRTLREVKAREAALRKRPKQFVLTEMAREEWPERLRLREALLKLLRPAWRTYQLSTLLYNMDYILFDVPGTRDLVSYPYIDFEQHRHSVLFYNSRTGEHWEPKTPPGIPGRAVWQTRQGDVALLYARILSEQVSGSSWSCSGRCSWVICLGRDGTECWRFEPEMHREQSLEHIHSSEDGVVTLFASGINGGIVAGARIWQIDGETGKLLRTRSIPHGNEVHHLAYSKDLKRFVYCERITKDLVLLNDELEETARWPNYKGDAFFRLENLCGRLLWEQRYYDKKSVYLHDLLDGTVRKVPLEVPVYVLSVLPDGRILGVNEKQSILTVLNGEGIVVSRCTVPGEIRCVLSETNGVWIGELRLPKNDFVTSGALFDEAETHVWRLDPAKP
ncbi:MAG: hypothetical protein IJQ42_02595 [Oscillospiraceae bacterium]|nr:hypothetical protein [Oscillospiraceae bacterium]